MLKNARDLLNVSHMTGSKMRSFFYLSSSVLIHNILSLFFFSIQSFRESLEKADSKDAVKVIYEKEVGNPRKLNF